MGAKEAFWGAVGTAVVTTGAEILKDFMSDDGKKKKKGKKK